MASISTPYSYSATSSTRSRDLSEVFFGFGAMMLVLWIPTRAQLILGPFVLLSFLSIVLRYRPSLNDLGLGWKGLLPSIWILPAAVAVIAISVLLAKKFDVFHPLSQPDLSHVGGYLLWTCYQQFLLQDYFMPRMSRIFESDSIAVGFTALLFAVAHLPNLSLAAVTLIWGSISCLLFLRYRSLYVLGLAQGLLGLGFAVCVPDSLHHHMRVGLGYLHYHTALVLR